MSLVAGRRGAPQGVGAALAVAVLAAACSGAASTTTSPVSALHHAIRAVLDAPSVTVIEHFSTPSGSTPGMPTTSTETFVVNKPDRVAVTGTFGAAGIPPVVAIGSTGYVGSGPTRTVVHHTGEAANYTNDALMFLTILDQATTASEHAGTYTIPSAEADRILAATRLPQYRDAGLDASMTATVSGGAVRTEVIRTRGASSAVTTVTVERVGSSPTVTVPAG